jgi:hypothetical protein
MEAWDKAEPLTVFYVGKKFNQDAPYDCLRLKAFRRGEQDIEYATLLANQPGWDREAVSKAALNAVKLTGGIEQRNEEDAGAVTLKTSDEALDRLRLRIAKALRKKGD